MMDSDSGDAEEKRWKLFLNSPGEVPCLKRSLLSGILGGLGVGVAYFFSTSNLRRSTHAGFGGYFLITTGTWFYCRYTTAKERLKQRQIKAALQQRIFEEGTVELKDV